MLHKPSERRHRQETWAISFTLQLLLKFKMHFQKTTTFCSQQAAAYCKKILWHEIVFLGQTTDVISQFLASIIYCIAISFNTFNTPVRRSQVSLQDVWTEAWWFLVCPAGGLTASPWLCWAVQTGVDAADLPRHIALMAERACCCVSSGSVAAKTATTENNKVDKKNLKVRW